MASLAATPLRSGTKPAGQCGGSSRSSVNKSGSSPRGGVQSSPHLKATKSKLSSMFDKIDQISHQLDSFYVPAEVPGRYLLSAEDEDEAREKTVSKLQMDKAALQTKLSASQRMMDETFSDMDNLHNNIGELNHKIQCRNATIDELNHKLNVTSMEVISMRTQNLQLKNELGDSINRAQLLEVDRDKQENHFAAYKDSNTEQLADMKAKYDALRTKYDDKKLLLDTQAQQLDALRSEMSIQTQAAESKDAALCSEVRILRDKVVEVESVSRELDQQKQEAVQSIQKLSFDIDMLRAALSEREEENKKSIAKYTALISAVSMLRCKVADVDATSRCLHQQRQQAQRTLDTYRLLVPMLRCKIGELNSTAMRFNAHVRIEKSMNSAYRSLVAMLRCKLREVEDTSRGLHAQKRDSLVQLQAAESETRNKRSENLALREEVAALLRAEETNRESLATHVKTEKALQGIVSSLKHAVEQGKDALAVAECRNAKILAEEKHTFVNDVREEKRRFERLLVEQTADLVAKHNAEVGHISEKLAEAQEGNIALRTQLSDQSAELLRVDSRLKEAENTLSEAREQNMKDEAFLKHQNEQNDRIRELENLLLQSNEQVQLKAQDVSYFQEQCSSLENALNEKKITVEALRESLSAREAELAAECIKSKAEGQYLLDEARERACAEKLASEVMQKEQNNKLTSLLQQLDAVSKQLDMEKRLSAEHTKELRQEKESAIISAKHRVQEAESARDGMAEQLAQVNATLQEKIETLNEVARNEEKWNKLKSLYANEMIAHRTSKQQLDETHLSLRQLSIEKETLESKLNDLQEKYQQQQIILNRNTSTADIEKQAVAPAGTAAGYAEGLQNVIAFCIETEQHLKGAGSIAAIQNVRLKLSAVLQKINNSTCDSTTSTDATVVDDNKGGGAVGDVEDTKEDTEENENETLDPASAINKVTGVTAGAGAGSGRHSSGKRRVVDLERELSNAKLKLREQDKTIKALSDKYKEQKKLSAQRVLSLEEEIEMQQKRIQSLNDEIIYREEADIKEKGVGEEA